MNVLQAWAKKIEEFFTNLGNALHLQSFGDFMEKAFVAIRPQVIAELKDIALEAVTVAEQAFTAPGSGKEKSAQAFSTISEYAKNQAITASVNEINTVLELAVGVLKGNTETTNGNGGDFQGGNSNAAATETNTGAAEVAPAV